MNFQAGPITLATLAETEACARRLAPRLLCGDVILLSGPIGSGKSAFARALIRARLDNPAEDVPSPTFTIVQTYADATAEIWHCDLYRLSHPQEAIELGLDEAFETAICLIEWPDRISAILPARALSITLAAGDVAHQITVTGPEPWRNRLEGVLV